MGLRMVSGGGWWVVGCGLGVVGCGLWVVGCGLCPDRTNHPRTSELSQNKTEKVLSIPLTFALILGVSIGSEMSGGVRNVTVDGLFVANCAVGVYIKSMDGRGGVVEDISFRNVVAEQVIEPIRFAMDYTYRRRRRLGALEGDGGDDGGGDDDDTTPYFRNLSVINLTATRAVVAGTFEGLPASQIEGVYLKDVTVTGKDPGSTQRGRQEGPQFDGPKFKCRNASGIAIRTAPEACF